MADFSTLPPHLQAAYARDPRRGQAQFMQQRSFNQGDIKHPLQGLAQMLMAYKSGQKTKGLEEEFAGRGQAYNEALGRALGMIQPGTEEIPAAGPPTAMGEFPTATRDVPADYAGAAQEMAAVGGPLATQFAIAGAGRKQTQMDISAKRAYDEAQAKIKQERGIEAFRTQKEIEQEFAPEKERRIVKGADGRNYYADTGEPVLPGMKTPQEQFMELMNPPAQPTPLEAPDITGELDASVPAPNQYAALDDSGIDFTGGEPVDIAPPQMLAGLDTFDGVAEPDVAPSVETPAAQPSMRDIFLALPQEVQMGIQMSQDPMKALSSHLLKSKGMDIQFNEDGTIKSITQGGAGGGWGKKATGTIEEKLFNAREGLARLSGIEQSARPEFLQTGPRLNAAWSGIKESMGVDLNPEDKAFLADYSTFKMNAIENINRYIKEITGAQMSEAEATRLRKGVPDPGDSWYNGDSPTQFNAKLKAQTRSLRAANARYTYALKNGWDMNPDRLANSLPLDKVEDLIEERGAALERQLRARQPDMSDEAVENFVGQSLSAEFGIE